MKFKFPRLSPRIPSLALSLVLQLCPLIRAGSAGASAALSPVILLARWLAGAAAVTGSMHAVSGATGMTLTQGGKVVKSALGTNGVTFSGTRVSIRSDSFGNAQSYQFDGLPPGLNGSPQGVVTGVPAAVGDFPVTVTGWQRSGFSGFNFSLDYVVSIVDAVASAPPQVDVPPQGQHVVVGSVLTLSVSASGTGLTFQWIKDGQELPGQTGSSLVLDPVALTDSGSYQVRVSNSAGAVTTTAVQVLVSALAPQVTPLPARVPLYAGEALQLKVTASGAEPLSYQWAFNGLPLAGETTSTLVRSGVDSRSAGTWSVVVADSNGGKSTGGPVEVTVENTNPALRWVDAGIGAVPALEVVSIPGRIYRLESTGSLADGVWTEVNSVTASDSATRWTIGAQTEVSRFWRVSVLAFDVLIP